MAYTITPGLASTVRDNPVWGYMPPFGVYDTKRGTFCTTKRGVDEKITALLDLPYLSDCVGIKYRNVMKDFGHPHVMKSGNYYI